MRTINLQIEKLKELGIDVPDKGKFVIDLYTDWCGPCKIISPVLKQFQEEGLIELKQINIGEQRKIGEELNISAVPTLIFLKDGKLLEKNISIQGRTLVYNSVMVGAAGELILKEIIDQM